MTSNPLKVKQKTSSNRRTTLCRYACKQLEETKALKEESKRWSPVGLRNALLFTVFRLKFFLILRRTSRFGEVYEQFFYNQIMSISFLLNMAKHTLLFNYWQFQRLPGQTGIYFHYMHQYVFMNARKSVLCAQCKKCCVNPRLCYVFSQWYSSKFITKAGKSLRSRWPRTKG